MTEPNQIWLSVDLSSPKGTVALHEFTQKGTLKLLSSKTITESGEHSETLLPQLESLLKGHCLKLTQISKLITSSGPGSFTGLRIAFASLKALAYGAKIPIEIINGSEARALSLLTKHADISDEDFYVITHITTERFVSAHFKKQTDKSFRLLEEESRIDWSFIQLDKPSIIILDGRVEPSKVPSKSQIKVYVEPLHAEHLGQALLTARSRLTFPSITDWGVLGPNYFGSTRY